MTNTEPSALTTGGTKDNLQLIYILMLLGLLTGFLTSIVAVVMAYVGKADVKDWMSSHYSFVIRTFWIGFLYAVVSTILIPALLLGLLLWAGVYVWFIVRCVQGLDYLGKGAPIPKPQSWLFAS